MRKNIVRFPHALFSFISRYLLVITLAMKLKDVNYKTHWNILVFCDQWKIRSYLTLSHWKMSNFVLFLLFRLSVITKLRNFDLESHWNTLIFFDKKRYGVRFELEIDRQFEYFPWKNIWFFFIFIAWVHFSLENEKFRFWKSLK